MFTAAAGIRIDGVVPDAVVQPRGQRGSRVDVVGAAVIVVVSAAVSRRTMATSAGHGVDRAVEVVHTIGEDRPRAMFDRGEIGSRVERVVRLRRCR